MIYFNDYLTPQTIKKSSVVALGNFDGIHKGHRSLINCAKKSANNQDFLTVVFSFYPHPSYVLKDLKPVKMIYSKEEKKAVLDMLNIDIFIEYPFTIDIAQMTPERFVKDILIEKLHAKKVIVGDNYYFGYKRKGNVKMLKEFGNKLGFEVEVARAVCFNNDIVSSTRIRGLIQNGEIEKANKLLTLPYFISGYIQHGKELGRLMGFPTINLKYNEQKIYPSKGVYFSRTYINNNVYNSITNIGHNPTVESDNAIKLETHLLKYNGDLYGKFAKVELIKKLRDENRFKSINELSNQIGQDLTKAEKFFYSKEDTL